MNANKPRAPGSTKEIVDELVDIAGGPKQVAFILGMHPSTIAAYTDPAIATHMNYDQVRRLTERGHTLAAEDLARLAGGAFVPGKQSTDTLATALTKTCKEVGDFVTAIVAGAADGAYSAADKRIIRAEFADAARELLKAGRKLDDELQVVS